MKSCPSCQGVLSENAAKCPHCGFELTTGARPASSSGSGTGTGETPAAGERPAHLALLDGGAPPPPPLPRAVIDAGKAKPRLESRAGPAMPAATKKLDDVVPEGASGWLARLESAKKAQLIVAQPTNPTATPGGSSGGAPPPIKRVTAPRKSIEAKPAHLLLAELEQAEQTKKKERQEARAREASGIGEDSSNAIAGLEIEKPEAKIHHRQVPKWLWVSALLVCALGFAAFGIYKGQKDPVKAKELDPVLLAKQKRIKEAVAARDLGNEQVMQGKYEEAIVSFGKALELKPDMGKAERGLALAYAGKGDNEAAIKHYRRYLKISPKAPDRDAVQEIIDKYEKGQADKADKAEKEKKKKKGRR